jgi:glutamyl-tRNA synthetase
MEDMKGMGLDWDEGPDVGGSYGPYVQNVRKEKYLEFVQKLFNEGLIYPCTRSRKEIREQGLLSLCKDEYLYPESFRPGRGSWNQSPFSSTVNWRFCTAWGERILLEDKRLGKKSFTIGKNFSDFLVWRKDGTASYELATVVDDILMRITEVVRGEDLLVSSARQSLLFNAFKQTTPAFYHCGLVKGADGKKLSKSSRSLPRLFSLT